MAMLTEERAGCARKGELTVLGVAAGVKVFAGGMGARNAAGYAAPASDKAGLVVIGRFTKTVDNTAGADGDQQVPIERGAFLWDAAGLTAADAGKNAFVTDDQTINTGGGTNKVFAGVIMEVPSATEAWVLQGPAVKPVPAAAVAAVAAADASAQSAAYVQADVQTIATLATENKTKLNAVIAALKAAGLMAAA